MTTIKELLPTTQRTYTPEQLAAAKEKQRERMAEDLGMCQTDCEVCGGMGYYREYKEQGAYVLIIQCPNVDPWSLPSASRYGINKEEFETLQWENVIRQNDIGPAVDAISEVLRRGYGWVFVWGSWGIGKTLLLKTATAKAMRLGQSSAYVRMAEILDHLREAFADGVKETDAERLRWWAGLDFLAIDEFDKVRGTSYGEERRFVLMDKRYEQAIREESITIIASNEEPERLPGYLFDRVRDGRFHMVKLSGSSLRPGMEWSE